MSARCCCGTCHVAGDGCGQFANGTLWCKCMPMRACASLTLDSEPLVVLDTDIMSFVCRLGVIPPNVLATQPGWAGSLSYNGTTIDLQFTLESDDDGLCLYLESDALGLSYTESEDNRLRQPMGGEYQDAAVRRATCKSLGLEFPVTLPDYAAATITIEAADTVSKKPIHTCGPLSADQRCLCSNACVIYSDLDEYGNEITERVNVCSEAFDEYESGWEAEFLDGSVIVRIVIDDPEPLTFRLEVVGGLPSPDTELQEVCCPTEDAGCNMRAAWTFTDSDATITIKGNPFKGCVDCKCFCECLCVQWFPIGGGQFQGVVCYDAEYETWTGDLANIDDPESTLSVGLYLECNECTGVTSLKLSGYEDLEPGELNCPDLFQTFHYDDPDEGFSAIVQCAWCDSGCPEVLRGVDCCNEVDVPLQLFADFVGDVDCTCDDILNVELNWREFSPFNLPPTYYQFGTGVSARYFAYESAEFDLCGNPNRTARLYVSPCSDTIGPGCGVGQVAWKAILVIEGLENVEDSECMADCTTVLISFTTLCPPGSADDGNWTVTISE